MYIVYWSVVDTTVTPSRQIHSEAFGPKEMSQALNHMEALRRRKYDNKEPIFGVVLACENPDSVGELGVDVTGPDYNWTKRR